MIISKCKACGAEIVFMVTKRGRQNPVNIDSIPIPEGAIEREYIEALPATTMFDYNSHTSHFMTCPQASKFKKLAQRNKDKKDLNAPDPKNIQEALL